MMRNRYEENGICTEIGIPIKLQKMLTLERLVFTLQFSNRSIFYKLFFLSSSAIALIDSMHADNSTSEFILSKVRRHLFCTHLVMLSLSAYFIAVHICDQHINPLIDPYESLQTLQFAPALIIINADINVTSFSHDQMALLA